MNLHINEAHWRIRLFRDSGSMVEQTFAQHDDAVDWINFRSANIYPYMEVEEHNDIDNTWEFKESFNRTH